LHHWFKHFEHILAILNLTLRFKQPVWFSADMRNQASKNITGRTAAEEKDTEAQIQ